jgi:hypothetical protein
MGVEKQFSVVLNRKPSRGQTRKEYHNRDLCWKLSMEVAEELLNHVRTTYVVFSTDGLYFKCNHFKLNKVYLNNAAY